MTDKVTKEKRRPRLHLAFDILDIFITLFLVFTVNLLIFSQQPDVLSTLGKYMTGIIASAFLIFFGAINTYRAYKKDGFIHKKNKS